MTGFQIKEYWDAGIDTEDIPEDELKYYGEGDVKNTDIVYLKQREKLEQMGLIPYMEVKMRAIAATIEMEHNGMPFNKYKAMQLAAEIESEMSVILARLKVEMESVHPHLCNPLSGAQVGKYLFGGDVKYDDKEDMIDDDGKVIKFKSGAKIGQVRQRKIEKVDRVRGVPRLIGMGSHTETGAWATGEDVLIALQSKHPFIPHCLLAISDGC